MNKNQRKFMQVVLSLASRVRDAFLKIEKRSLFDEDIAVFVNAQRKNVPLNEFMTKLVFISNLKFRVSNLPHLPHCLSRELLVVLEPVARVSYR
jgi:hypothetical protein